MDKTSDATPLAHSHHRCESQSENPSYKSGINGFWKGKWVGKIMDSGDTMKLYPDGMEEVKLSREQFNSWICGQEGLKKAFDFYENVQVEAPPTLSGENKANKSPIGGCSRTPCSPSYSREFIFNPLQDVKLGLSGNGMVASEITLREAHEILDTLYYTWATEKQPHTPLQVTLKASRLPQGSTELGLAFAAERLEELRTYLNHRSRLLLSERPYLGRILNTDKSLQRTLSHRDFQDLCNKEGSDNELGIEASCVGVDSLENVKREHPLPSSSESQQTASSGLLDAPCSALPLDGFLRLTWDKKLHHVNNKSGRIISEPPSLTWIGKLLLKLCFRSS